MFNLFFRLMRLIEGKRCSIVIDGRELVVLDSDLAVIVDALRHDVARRIRERDMHLHVEDLQMKISKFIEES